MASKLSQVAFLKCCRTEFERYACSPCPAANDLSAACASSGTMSGRSIRSVAARAAFVTSASPSTKYLSHLSLTPQDLYYDSRDLPLSEVKQGFQVTHRIGDPTGCIRDPAEAEWTCRCSEVRPRR